MTIIEAISRHAIVDRKSLKKELNKLYRSMDYIVDNFLSKRNITAKKVKAFCAIYQQLGLLWEFLGCQCKHWDGYRKKDGKFSCKIWGKIKGIKENYYILPVIGQKVIGRIVRPGKDNFKKVPKKQAQIINDTIKFHGTKLKVSVFNNYISRLYKMGKEINIAADRMVTLKEDRLTVEIGKYIASLKINGEAKQAPVYGAFLWELPKKLLKRIPVILSHDRYGRLVELKLFR